MKVASPTITLALRPSTTVADAAAPVLVLPQRAVCLSYIKVIASMKQSVINHATMCHGNKCHTVKTARCSSRVAR